MPSHSNKEIVNIQLSFASVIKSTIILPDCRRDEIGEEGPRGCLHLSRGSQLRDGRRTMYAEGGRCGRSRNVNCTRGPCP